MRCSVLSHIVQIALTWTHVLLPLPTAANWANAATCNLCHELLRHVRTCRDWLQTHPTQWTTTTIPIRILFEQTSYMSQIKNCFTCFLSITCILVFTYGKWLAVVRMVFLLYCSCNSPCARPPGVNGVAYTNLSVKRWYSLHYTFKVLTFFQTNLLYHTVLDMARSYSDSGTHYGTCQWTGIVKILTTTLKN